MYLQRFKNELFFAIKERSNCLNREAALWSFGRIKWNVRGVCRGLWQRDSIRIESKS